MGICSVHMQKKGEIYTNVCSLNPKKLQKANFNEYLSTINASSAPHKSKYGNTHYLIPTRSKTSDCIVWYAFSTLIFPNFPRCLSLDGLPQLGVGFNWWEGFLESVAVVHVGCVGQ